MKYFGFFLPQFSKVIHGTEIQRTAKKGFSGLIFGMKAPRKAKNEIYC